MKYHHLYIVQYLLGGEVGQVRPTSPSQIRLHHNIALTILP